MEAIDFIVKITENGTNIRLPNDKCSQITNVSGDSPFNNMSIITYQTDAAMDGKSANKVLEEITLTAINAETADDFVDFVLYKIPRNYRDNNATTEQWEKLLHRLQIAISNKLSSEMIKERHFPGASMWLRMLTTRIKAWQKQASVKVEAKQEEGAANNNLSITFNVV